MTDIWKTLADCTAAYDEAKRQAQKFRTEETQALNNLNDAQKAVDAFVADQKKGSPRESNWKQERDR